MLHCPQITFLKWPIKRGVEWIAKKEWSILVIFIGCNRTLANEWLQKLWTCQYSIKVNMFTFHCLQNFSLIVFSKKKKKRGTFRSHLMCVSFSLAGQCVCVCQWVWLIFIVLLCSSLDSKYWWKYQFDLK